LEALALVEKHDDEALFVSRREEIQIGERRKAC
jgi:hypothetical protein